MLRTRKFLCKMKWSHLSLPSVFLGIGMYLDAEADSCLQSECSKVCHETSLLLVDFNIGEDLENKKIWTLCRTSCELCVYPYP